MLCDETQDILEGFMSIVYKEIKDCVFFIDEAQRFYSYPMQNIAQIFHHFKFEKFSMQECVKNLKMYIDSHQTSQCALLKF